MTPAASGAPAVPRRAAVLVPLLVGAAVSVALGVYGKVHDPSHRAIETFGFSSMIGMKVWLTSVAAGLAVVQLVTALRLFGKLGRGHGPGWVPVLHRVSGTLAVVVSAPVAFHCLWSLGLSTYDSRTLVHSLLGCAFYGAFVAKLLVLKSRRMPGWALPVLGGTVFTVLVLVFLTSAAWYFQSVGSPGY